MVVEFSEDFIFSPNLHMYAILVNIFTHDQTIAKVLFHGVSLTEFVLSK